MGIVIHITRQMAIQGERKKRAEKLTDTRLNLVADIITDAQWQIIEDQPVNAMAALAVAKDILANLIEENHGKENKTEVNRAIKSYTENDARPNGVSGDGHVGKGNTGDAKGDVRGEKVAGDCQCPRCVQRRGS